MKGGAGVRSGGMMGYAELLMIAVGLSMDAFAVSLCKGLGMSVLDTRGALLIASCFGGFQALNPLIGWALGRQFERYIVAYDHWVAFILLGLIGGKMLLEAARKSESDEHCRFVLDYRELLGLGLATSIDALAVGVTFAFLKVSILPAVAIIGIVTFAISFAGVALGHRVGSRFRKGAEFAGGAVLILIGLKILLEHLGGF